jgi:hypothetical protein
MTQYVDNTVTLEAVRLIFRNFAGKEGKYNREGDRNFSVLLDDDIAGKMAEDGWNIKMLASREEGEPPQPYITVSVGFKNRPPRIVMITSKGRTSLSEDECEVLDWVDIKTVDLVLRPYSWAVGDKVGVKAYLKTIFVHIHEDPLELKYADLDELPARAGRTDDGE